MNNKNLHFHDLIKAVIENNKINDGKWADWRSAYHIQKVYGRLKKEYRETAELFLEKLIEHDAFYLSEFVDTFSILEYGLVLRYPGLNS